VDWDKAIAAATDRLGGIDVLVNNAGFGGVGSVKDIPVEIKGLDRRRLFRVLDCIEANLEGDLTLDHLASIACLSRFHFARAFKAVLGKTPHQYVTAKRIERAKALLIRGDQSLVAVALALNFSSQANFTRAFRRLTGQTPGQYRSNYRLQ
jgi:AraC family transcriptional regulator